MKKDFSLFHFKTVLIDNLPLILSLTILSLSLFYTFNQLSISDIELKQDNNIAINDFSNELNLSINSQIKILETVMVNEWLNVGNNISLLYSYSRYLQIVPLFYNYSDSYLAINWVNSTGFITWVYPYARNAGAINKSVVYYSSANGGGLNDAFYVASHYNVTGFTKYAGFFQGGEGFVAYIPIIYKNMTTGYFNVAFEISHIINNILQKEQSLNDYSFKIFENNTLVSTIGENFSLGTDYVAMKSISFYSKIWIIYSRPLNNIIFQTTPLSVLDIFTAEFILCILTYYLTNQLKRKNSIIKKEYDEKEKILETVYRSKRFESLGTLSGGIAHDFNNIMTNIKGHVELIKSKIIELKIKNESDDILSVNNSLSAIERNLDRAKDITSQILSFSRQGPKKYETIPINDILQESLKLVRETADKRINFIFSPTVQYYVVADQTRLLQVFLNILINSVNAIQSFENAIIKITCEIDSEDFNSILLDNAKKLVSDQSITFQKHGLIIKIRDNGRGMSQDQVNNAFDPFYMPKISGKGTGLGLSIVYNNVQLMNGEISIRSEIGNFTEITIKLPFVTILNTETKLIPKNGQPTITELEPIPKGSNILMIDDEQDIIQTYSQILKEKGFNVFSFTKGEQGLDYYDKFFSKIDLAIIDMNLPDVNGSDIIKHVRSVKKDQRILVITGYFEGDLNFHDIPVLRKPFEVEQALSIIYNLLRKKLL